MSFMRISSINKLFKNESKIMIFIFIFTIFIGITAAIAYPIVSDIYHERRIELCQCYAKYGCNWSSWIMSALGGTKVCNKCNSNFINISGQKHGI